MTSAEKAAVLAAHPDTGGSHEAACDLLGRLRPAKPVIPLSGDDGLVLSWLDAGAFETSEIAARLELSEGLVRGRLIRLERLGLIHATLTLVPGYPQRCKRVLVWRLGKKPIAQHRKALVA